MRAVKSGLIAYQRRAAPPSVRMKELLTDDWQRTRELAKQAGMPLHNAAATLNAMARVGDVVKDTNYSRARWRKKEET